MMIMLSPEDFRKLSPASQREVLALFTGVEVEPQLRDDEMVLPYEIGDKFNGPGDYVVLQGTELESEWASGAPAPGVLETGAKMVIDISPDQARELIANVSEKSQEALRLFSSGQPVLLEVLIGPSAPYRDLNDLKRSLVGAVNRRLRTVTENRSAVLFSSNREKTRIRVTSLTAAALRQALNVQEPMPSFEYYDQVGSALNNSTKTTIEFQNLLTSAWANLSLRPLAGQWALETAQIYGHLIVHGFSLATARPQVDEGGGDLLRYPYEPTSGDDQSLVSQMDSAGNIRVAGPEGITRLRVLVRHPNITEISCSVSNRDRGCTVKKVFSNDFH